MADWIPIDMKCEEFLPEDRPYGIIEASFYLQLAHAKRYNATIYGLAEKWQWSRSRVATFMERSGAKIVYHGAKIGTVESINDPAPGGVVIFKVPDWLKASPIIKRNLVATQKRPINKPRRKGVSLSVRYDVLRRDNFQCVLCAASGKDARIQIDHILPVSKGGTNDISNLRVLCFKCNHGKKDKVECQDG
jgi:hypothetical protein